MIENEIKQTRCVTCEAEHPYRGARVPARRRKAASPEALFQQVLAGREKTAPPPVEPPPAPGAAAGGAPSDGPSLEVVQPNEAPERPNAEGRPDTEDEGPVHRPLIRATLPRPEGQPPPRPNPQFTIRQLPGKKGGPFREGKRASWPPEHARAAGPLSRFAGPGRTFGPRGRPASRADKKRSR